jgi:archaellum component FlaF (FlaF/FlaG flagellin family)
MANYPYPYTHSNITVPNGATVLGPFGTGNNPVSITGTSGSSWINQSTTAATITAKGKLEIEGDDADITINGQSLMQTMQIIQDRLAILVPDPKKLEQFEALKQAYEHYKTLEALCCDSTTPKSDK